MKQLKGLALGLAVVAFVALTWAVAGWCQWTAGWTDTGFQGTLEPSGFPGVFRGLQPGDTRESIVLKTVDPKRNLALSALSAVDDKGVDLGRASKKSVCDGDSSTEWNTMSANVTGKYIEMDLGADYGIQRIEIRAGYYLIKNKKPAFFIKGYSIAVASSDDPGIFKVVAEKPLNTKRDVDTSVDATWLRTDDLGNPLSTIGRYVRVKITRNDGSNFVVIGEIRVYGTGYQKVGYYESKAQSVGAVDFGRAVWEGDVPTGASLGLQFRTGTSTTSWEAEWGDVPVAWVEGSSGQVGLDVSEGRQTGSTNSFRYVQYRAQLVTTASYLTPKLSSLTVQYDTRLAATAAYGSVLPDTVQIWDGKQTVSQHYTYTVDLTLGTTDRGVKQLVLRNVPGVEVEDVLVDGGSVARTLLQTGPDLSVALDDGIMPGATTRNVELKVVFDFKFLSTDTRIRGRIASLDTPPAGSDQYLNYQSLQESGAGDDTWSVTVLGIPPSAMPDVVVEPNPFNPVSGSHPRFGKGAAFLCDVAKIGEPRTMEISVFDLSGKRVITWSGTVEAGASLGGQWVWDGRNEDGDLVSPGLYVYQVILRSDQPSTGSGLIGVAY